MNQRPLYIFLGPPGSGKGTQGHRIQEKLQCTYLATGDLVREMSARAGSGDPFYDEIKYRKDNGILQPDDIIIKAVDKKLSEIDMERGIVFDAFPMSVEQAQGLEKLRERYEFAEPTVISIEVSRDSVVERLSKRRYCPVCNKAFLPGTVPYEKNACDQSHGTLIMRDDDKPEVVKRRYQEYSERLRDVADFYERKGWLHKINGEGSVAVVAGLIDRVLPV